MRTLAVIMLHRVEFGAGPGAVVELSDKPMCDILKRYTDRDGARSEKLRIWLGWEGMKVGDIAVLRAEAEAEVTK